MRPDFPDMTEPTYILFDGKPRAGRSKLHRVPVEDFFNSLLGEDVMNRPPTRRHLLQRAAAVLAAPFLARTVSAQTAWPTRPVRVIIPYPPAGG